jgi:hypothetical protein
MVGPGGYIHSLRLRPWLPPASKKSPGREYRKTNLNEELQTGANYARQILLGVVACSDGLRGGAR